MRDNDRCPSKPSQFSKYHPIIYTRWKGQIKSFPTSIDTYMFFRHHIWVPWAFIKVGPEKSWISVKVRKWPQTVVEAIDTTGKMFERCSKDVRKMFQRRGGVSKLYVRKGRKKKIQNADYQREQIISKFIYVMYKLLECVRHLYV